MLQFCIRAVPAAHSVVSEGRLRTLGSLPFALLQQAAGGTALDTTGSGIVGRVAHFSTVSKIALACLGLLSVISWGIIFYKLWTFRRSERQSAQFLDVFRRSNKFSEVQAVCRSLSDSPLVGLFQAGYTELSAQLRQGSSAEIGNGPNPNPHTPAVRPTLKSLTAVDRALMRASVVEVNKLEGWITVLATTASIAPFIGLFGTVWGILGAFEGIGQTGSTNLGVVAPGIAEALVATAAGLAAAIPAVLFYNYLTQRTKVFASGMDDLSME